MEMVKETQSQSKTNFITNLDFDVLPHKSMKFLPCTFNRDLMFELPPLDYDNIVPMLNLLLKMDNKYDGHVLTMAINIIVV